MMTTYTPSTSTRAVTVEVVERMAARDVTAEELSERSGLGLIALRNRLDGRAPWNLDEIDAVCQALHVSPWLLLGLPDIPTT